MVTTSQAVAAVNQTGEAMFGLPFSQRTTCGVIVHEPNVVVATGDTSAIVNLSACTSPLP